MSLAKDKSKIIEKVKLLISIANSDIDVKAYEDIINQSDDPIDFLLGLIKSTIGENVLEGLVQLALTEILTQKKLDELSNKIYDNIGKNLSKESLLPSSVQSGMTMPVKSIDVTDSFRRAGVTGSTASKETNQFFKKMVDDVLKNTNQDFVLPGISPNQITVRYEESKSEITVKFPNLNQKELFDSLILAIGPLFSSTAVINEIINLLFHTDFTKQDAKVTTLIRSYIKNTSVEGGKIDLKNLLEIENATSIKGLTLDIGCFAENIEITQAQIDAVILNPTVKNFNSLLPQLAQDRTSNLQNAYHADIIKKIGEALLNMLLKQPGVIFILNIVEKISDLNFNFNTSIEELWERFKNFFLGLFDNIYEIFICVILDYLKKFLIKLVIVVTIKFLKEQLEKRKDVILSLSTGGLATRLKETKTLI
jgi:hypothetical protein